MNRSSKINFGTCFADHQTVKAQREGIRPRGWHHHEHRGRPFLGVHAGLKGTYQHGSSDHLHRFLAEFDFRYSNRTAWE